MEIDTLVLEAKNVGVLHSHLDENIIIYHPVGLHVKTLAEKNLIDVIIVDSEDGWSQLGMMRRFLSADLGLRERDLVKYILDGCPTTFERNISSLADWNRYEAADVTLISIPSFKQDSLLKGVILAPYEYSHCYSKYAIPQHGKPYRDFFYNVTYEAISYAFKVWGAVNIGLAQLNTYSRIKNGGDIAKCQVEALVHFCNENKGIQSFTLIGDFWESSSLEMVRQFSNMDNIGSHRMVSARTENRIGVDFTYVDWSHGQNISPNL